MTLRSDIEQAIKASAGKHPYGPLPPNLNRTGRAPSPFLTDPGILKMMREPGFAARLRLLQQDPSPEMRDMVGQLLADLRQFRRAENNERALPGDYAGDDSLPYLPLPYQGRDTHRPDRLPGSETHKAYKAAVDQLDANDISTGLAQKMHTASQVAAIEAREDAAPPTLRESVSAAYSTHQAQEN